VSTIKELLERKSLENGQYGRRDSLRWLLDTLFPQKLSLILPTSGGCSVGTVRSRTKIRSLFLLFVCLLPFLNVVPPSILVFQQLRSKILLGKADTSQAKVGILPAPFDGEVWVCPCQHHVLSTIHVQPTTNCLFLVPILFPNVLATISCGDVQESYHMWDKEEGAC
jgi:hypothetical protein